MSNALRILLAASLLLATLSIAAAPAAASAPCERTESVVGYGCVFRVCPTFLPVGVEIGAKGGHLWGRFC